MLLLRVVVLIPKGEGESMLEAVLAGPLLPILVYKGILEILLYEGCNQGHTHLG